MRAREFLMKDCYSFDISKENAIETYEQFNDIYKQIFQTIGVPFLKGFQLSLEPSLEISLSFVFFFTVQGDTGIMGGSMSHEFHFPAEIGEDTLVTCSNCNFSTNREMIENTPNECLQCKQNSLQITPGIEV